MSTKKKKHLWKFLNTGMKSAHGEQTWTVGKWEKISGKLSIYENGFHASEYISDALGYVAGTILARVEVRGESVVLSDKQAWSEMRVLEAYHWTKSDSVRMAIFAARLVLPEYEARHPEKVAPRRAIETAEAWLANQCTKTRVAAARAADAAAAFAATSAATYAVTYAARAGGAAEVRKRLQEWCENHVKTLKTYNE